MIKIKIFKKNNNNNNNNNNQSINLFGGDRGLVLNFSFITSKSTSMRDFTSFQLSRLKYIDRSHPLQASLRKKLYKYIKCTKTLYLMHLPRSPSGWIQICGRNYFCRISYSYRLRGFDYAWVVKIRHLPPTCMSPLTQCCL